MKVNARTRAALAEIGETIRVAREASGLSQAKLAAKIGMLRTNYIRVEKGRLNLTIETLVRIAEGIGVPLRVTLGPPQERKRREAR